MSRRIVVLGADGFIGRRVIAALAGSGWATPVAAARHSAVTVGVVERCYVDATVAASVQSAINGADGIVNCIAGNAAAIVANAEALFAATRASKAMLVHISSMAVYGSATGYIDEAAPLLGDTSPYAAAKLAAERVLQRYPRTISLRPGIVYGHGSLQWSARIADWLNARRIGDLGAGGDGLCNLVHVDDIATAVLAALGRLDLHGQAYNLGSPEPPTWNEYFFRYAKALGAVPIRRITRRQLQFEKLAAIPLKAAELIASKARLELRLPPPMPSSLLATWRQELRLDVRRAERDLGLVWTSLDTGLAKAAAVYRKN